MNCLKENWQRCRQNYLVQLVFRLASVIRAIWTSVDIIMDARQTYTYHHYAFVTHASFNNSLAPISNDANDFDNKDGGGKVMRLVSPWYFYVAILTWIVPSILYTMVHYIDPDKEVHNKAYGYFGDEYLPLLYNYKLKIDRLPKCLRTFLQLAIFPWANFLISVACMYLMIPIASLYIGIKALINDAVDDDAKVFCKGFGFSRRNMAFHRAFEQIGEAMPQLILGIIFTCNNYDLMYQSHDAIFETDFHKTVISIIFSFGTTLFGIARGCKVGYDYFLASY